MKNVNNFKISKVQPQGVAQHLVNFFTNFSLALLIKVLFMQKSMQSFFKGLSIVKNFLRPDSTPLKEITRVCEIRVMKPEYSN